MFITIGILRRDLQILSSDDDNLADATTRAERAIEEGYYNEVFIIEAVHVSGSMKRSAVVAPPPPSRPAPALELNPHQNLDPAGVLGGQFMVDEATGESVAGARGSVQTDGQHLSGSPGEPDTPKVAPSPVLSATQSANVGAKAVITTDGDTKLTETTAESAAGPDIEGSKPAEAGDKTTTPAPPTKKDEK